MYKRILVPLDGSPMGDRVLPYVRNLGRKLDAKVELFRVFDTQPEFFYPEPFLYQDQYGDSSLYREEVMTSLGMAKTNLESAGVAAKAVMHEPEHPETDLTEDDHKCGTPAQHIVAESEKVPDTLIVMSTHGRSGLGRWVMGSVTDKVLHSVKTPMLVIRTEGNDAFLDGSMGHIIVPLDGSKLAETILPHAAGLAKALNATLCLVRVTPDDNLSVDARNDLKWLAEQAREDGVSSVESKVLYGNPGAAIVGLTHEYPDSLVAMTTHGRSGMSRWLMGSVADKVVRQAAGPVLVLRG